MNERIKRTSNLHAFLSESAVRRVITILIRIVLFLLTILSGTLVQADVFNVTQKTIKRAISLQSTTVTIAWRMDVDLTCPDTNPVRVFSDFAIVGYLNPVTKTTVSAVVYKSLSKTVTAPTTVSFLDGIQIPISIVRRAINDGVSVIQVARSFRTPNGTGCPGIGNAAAVITGSSATGFSINRQSMRFDDNSIIKLINVKEALKAKADVNYGGSGQLRATWEVAGPSTAGGVPIFRTLRPVRKYLLVGDKTTFISPILPTTIAGAYMVRMRITSPPPGFDSPIIRYFVGARGASVAPPLPMRLGNPADRAWLSKDTLFDWQGIAGVKHYRLEFYTKAAETDIASTLPNLGDNQTSKKPVRLKGSPAAGIMLPSDVLQTGLSPIVRRHLIAGRWYYWRIVAIGKDGKIVGLSPIREARMP